MAEYKVTGFCTGDYTDLVTQLLSLGYRHCRLDELVPDKPLMFLRHDVDLCLDRALELAEVEHRLGVSSTFYLLISTNLYNLASAASRRIMRRLLDLGHSIGLHFDATQYDGGRADLEAAAQRECLILETLCERRVDSISFHRPARHLIGMPNSFAGRRHAYEPQFFSDVGYISDSNGGWHHGHPLDHPSVQVRGAIQLLTHPVWWTTAAPVDRVAMIHKVRLEQDERRRDDIAATITSYREWLRSNNG